MATLDVLRTIKVRAQHEGTTEAEAALNRVRVATKQLDASNEDAAKSMATNERAIRSLLRSYEEGYSSTEKLTKIQKDLSIGVAAGRVSMEQAAAIYDAAADKLLGLTRATEMETQAAAKSAAANDALRGKYDLAFAAAKKLAGATAEIALAQREAGLSSELAQAAIQKETQAYNAQITTLERLARAGKDAAIRGVVQSGAFQSARDRGADVQSAFGDGGARDQVRAQFDQVFAAGQKYRGMLSELRDALALGAISEGVYRAELAKSKAAFADQMNGLGQYSKAQRDAAQAATEAAKVQAEASRIQADAADKLRVVQMMLATQNPARNRGEDIAAYASELDRLQAEFDPAFAALQKYDGYLDRLDRAHRVGAISMEVMTARLTEATNAYDAEIAKINGVVVAVEALSAAEERAIIVRQKLSAIQAVMGSGGYRAPRDRGADAESVFGVGGSQDVVRAKYDPLFRATEEYKRGLQELREAASLTTMSQDVYAAALGRLKDAFNARRVELGALSKAERDAAQAAKDAADTTAAADAKRAAAASAWANLKGAVPVDRNAEASRALGSLSSQGLPSISAAAQKERAALLPMAAAQMQYAETVARSEAALKSKVITEAEHQSVLVTARGTLLNQTNEYNKATAAAERNTKGTGLNAYAWQNLGYQINDVVTSLGSGISPMQTLAQQGGQIFQILQSDEGGVAGGLKSIGMRIKELATPTNLMFGAMITGAAGAAYALYSYNAELAKVRVATQGIGRATGATVGNINALAPEAGRNANVSTSEARTLSAAFASTGAIGVSMYRDLIKLTKDYALTTGTDLTKATEEVASAFASPTKGAEALNAKTGFLTRTLYENIRAMEESGNRAGAQKAFMEGLAASTAKAGDKVGWFAKSWEEFMNTTSNEVGGIGAFITKGLGLEDAEARVKTLQGQLDFRSARKGSLGGLFDSLWGFDEAQIRDDLAKAKAMVNAATQEGDTAYTNQKGIKIGAIVDSANPQLRALEQMEGKAKEIRDEFERLRITNPFGPAYDTMMGLERAAKQIRADMEAGGAAYAQSSRQAQNALQTVGYTPTAKSAADIEARATERGIAANREFQANNNGDAYAKALNSIESDRQTELKTLTETFKNSAAQLGGAFARAPVAVQEQILQATKIFGKIPAEILAAVGEKENAFKLSGPTKVLNSRGEPSTTAWGFGQITIPAEKDIRKLPGMENFDRMNPDTAILGTAAYLDIRRRRANDNLLKGLDGYGTGPGYGADVYRRAGKFGDVSPEGEMKDADARAQALKTLNEQLANNKKNYGESGLAVEANNKSIAEYNAKVAQGIPATDGLRKAIEAYSLAVVTAEQQQKLDRYMKDAEFERSNLGRTTEDAAAYSKARGMFGDTSSEAAKIVIETERLNDNLKFTRDLGKDAFSGFTSDLSKGVGVLDALSNAFGRFADKIISRMSDKAFTALFDAMTGGGSSTGGGGLGGIFSSLFGGGSGGGIDVGAQGWMPKFAAGGVATRASIFGEAGPEAAVPLPDGRRIPVMLSQPANSNGGVKVTVNNTQSQTTDAQVSEGPNGEVMIDIVDRGIARKTGQNRSAIQRAAGASLRG